MMMIKLFFKYTKNRKKIVFEATALIRCFYEEIWNEPNMIHILHNILLI